MGSPWLAAGIGAGQGLQEFIAQQRADELMKQNEQFRQAQLAETIRSHQANEGIQQSRYASEEADKKAAQDALAQSRQATQENALRDDFRTSELMRPIGSPVSIEDYGKAQRFGVLPMSLYQQSPGEPLPNGDVGPPVPTINFTGTAAQQKGAADTENARQDRLQTHADLLSKQEQDRQIAAQNHQDAQGNIAATQASTEAYRKAQLANTSRGLDIREAGQNNRVDNGPTVTIADPSAPGGTRIIRRADLPSGGAAGPAPQGLRSQAATNDVSMAELDRLEGMMKDEYVGPIEGRARSIGQYIPGVSTDEGFANFNAASAAFKNSVIKAITGAQMSEAEARRISQQIPMVTDKPEVWRAKAKQTRANLADLGVRLGGTPTAGAVAGGGGGSSFRVIGEVK